MHLYTLSCPNITLLGGRWLMCYHWLVLDGDAKPPRRIYYTGHGGVHAVSLAKAVVGDLSQRRTLLPDQRTGASHHRRRLLNAGISGCPIIVNRAAVTLNSTTIVGPIRPPGVLELTSSKRAPQNPTQFLLVRARRFRSQRAHGRD